MLVDGLVLLVRDILTKLEVEPARDCQQEVGEEACFDHLCDFLDIRCHRQPQCIVFPDEGLILQMEEGKAILSDCPEAKLTLSKTEQGVKQSGQIQKLYSFERNLA